MGTSGTAYPYIVDRLDAFFIEPDLFDNIVPFDNTTPIYLINLLWIGLGLGLDLYSCTVLAFFTDNNKNFTDGNLLLKERTQTTNNKIKLHIPGVPVNKLGDWLIEVQAGTCNLYCYGSNSCVQWEARTAKISLLLFYCFAISSFKVNLSACVAYKIMLLFPVAVVVFDLL